MITFHLAYPIRSTLFVESVMRLRRTSLFQGRLPLELHTKPGPVIEPKPVAHEFPPSQQMALLGLRDSDLACAVLLKLQHSTARAGYLDYHNLARRGLAARGPNGFHHLTPRGRYKADCLARELAQTLDVDMTAAPFRRKTSFSPGVLSQNGNW